MVNGRWIGRLDSAGIGTLLVEPRSVIWSPSFLRVILPVKPLAIFRGWPGLNHCHSGCMFHIGSIDMKMVFYSRDRLEVQFVSQELVAASIPCEVREGLVVRDALPNLSAPQLWIQEDGDLHRAFMVCVERSIGFAKRETDLPELNDCDRAIAA